MKKKILFLILAIPLFFGIGVLAAESRLRLAKSQPVVFTFSSQDKQEEKQESAALLPEEKRITEAPAENAGQANESPDTASSENINTGGTQPAKFAFAILGDTQYFKPGNAGGALQKAVGKIKNQNVDLVMAMGDLVSSCDGGGECEAKYASWKNVLGPLASKIYPTQGNHDRTGGEKADAAWQKIFTLPTNGPSGFSELAYSFDVQNSHFVVLDSEKPDEHVINSTQREWLERDLAASKKEKTFVFFHEPAYPVGSKIGESLDVKPQDRNALWEILSRHKTTAVFSGHEHIASRKKIGNIYQFVFGNTESFDHSVPKAGMAEWSHVGQNYGLVEVAGKSVTVKTYSVDGKELNSVSF